MEKIKKDDLKNWLIDYITDTIRGLKTDDSEDFNRWAANFKKEEAEFLVKMEYINDWGYDERTEIDRDEAEKYANVLMEDILKNWYL